ncbi:MAG TPA: MOFRL family protein, partial [Nitrososphaera sp.]|nr:MOFRL family protein [Nitrososphaera sp.]
GKYLAKLALDLKAGVQEYDALILGGETTVTIRRGKAGKGGRNQEAALSCASSIPQGVIAACIGTDGIDGNSDAAGALVSNVVPITARRQRESLRGHLACHNSYPLLKSAGSLIFTGRTGTNVNDIAIVYTPH